MSGSNIIRQPENACDRIWRYMDLPKLIYLLDRRKLYLSRADKFDDRHEGATPLIQKIWERQKDPKNSETFAAFRCRQREWTFISCWSHCDHESHALWRIYCGPKQGVAVCSQYFKLVKLKNPKVEDIMVGLVDYGRNEPIPLNTLVPFFRKRQAFAYEQEARFVANIYRCLDVHDETGKLLTPRPCLEIPLDLSAFIETIRIHPEADADYINVVKSLVKRYAPELMSRVELSEMAGPPVF
ncbi:MAG TPA: hypothetical protein VG077_10190 [Verrucomicrobiae bacterium]|nr:hypothetical protein [Verrucomicrobiae bacterium]